MKKYFFFFVLVFLFSCEKNVSFRLNDSEPRLVVDAQIENDKAPVVILTKTISYLDTINPQVLANSFVHAAEIDISNGTLTHRLKEYELPLIPGYSAWYYSIDSSNLATAFAGAFNTNYTLRILSEGKEYTSAIGIPGLLKVPDSIWAKPAPQNPDTNKRVLMVKVTDPPGLGNYFRYFTKVNSEPFLPGFNSVFDDQVIDGTSYTLEYPRGVDRNNLPSNDSNFFTKGDTITLKFSNIQKPVYTFWSTWEFSAQSIGNPFAQPNKVIGNISNGALGAFCGYASWYRTIIAQ
ncbi:MAG: DUF4249 domain-containing protein [Ferruginibacter sp.]